MGTTQGFIWLKEPSALQLADLRGMLHEGDWLSCPEDWHVVTVRHHEQVAAYLASRTWTTAVGWVEDSDLAALQLTSRRVGPVFLRITDLGREQPVLPITGRIPNVTGIGNVLRWCASAGLSVDEAELSAALSRDEVFAEDHLDAVVAALGLPRAPVG